MIPASEYFAGVSKQVFGDLLGRMGAHLEVDEPTQIQYRTSTWFVQIFILSDDYPPYLPRVMIGPMPVLPAWNLARATDICWTAPEDSPLRRYNILWPYDGPERMRHVLERVREEIFKPYAIPFLQDHPALLELIADRVRQIEKQNYEDGVKHNATVFRSRAAEALLAKDYSTYLDHMGRVPLELRTRSEQARMAYTRKLLSKGR